MNTTELVQQKFKPEELEQFKKEHGELSAIKVGDKLGLFKKPDRKTIGAAAAHINTDPIEYVAIIAENCFVAGDRELLEEDDYFLSLMPMMNDLVQMKEAELVKL